MVNTKIEGRIQWVDALKGFLILLVVMGHMADPKDASSGIYSFIYTFHILYGKWNLSFRHKE